MKRVFLAIVFSTLLIAEPAAIEELKTLSKQEGKELDNLGRITRLTKRLTDAKVPAEQFTPDIANWLDRALYAGKKS